MKITYDWLKDHLKISAREDKVKANIDKTHKKYFLGSYQRD